MAGSPVVVPSTEVPEIHRETASHREELNRHIVILKRGSRFNAVRVLCGVPV